MRLYVGGLPYQTTEEELISLFQQIGNVSTATIIIDRATGRSKGFGFVEMADTQEASFAYWNESATLTHPWCHPVCHDRCASPDSEKSTGSDHFFSGSCAAREPPA